MQNSVPSSLSTVSSAFIADWVAGLRLCSTSAQLASFLERVGLEEGEAQHSQRVTLDQIVHLYQIAAVETQDEMTGLWSRTIRPRALQHLLMTVREAGSLLSALHRFSTFWNLLLDDYQFDLISDGDQTQLQLRPIGLQQPQRFGHMLILKLAHGLISWLAGAEVPISRVEFAFARPALAGDYAVIFPATVTFSQSCSTLSFQTSHLGPAPSRSSGEAREFLDRAPRDWMFTSVRTHSHSLKVREYLFQNDWRNCRLIDAAQALKVTPRTLMRRLESEDTSFQDIKDGLRRDLAIRDLQEGLKSIDDISHEIGFSSSANFHRAFRRWTGVTPRSYRSLRA
jgi:AraC-like DNA-binding protein